MSTIIFIGVRTINKEQLFIQLEPKIKAKPNQTIRIEEVASVVCQDQGIVDSVLDTKILKAPNNNTSLVIFVLDIIKKIKKKHNNIDIVVFGNPEILLEVKDEKRTLNIVQYMRISIICIILFIGAGLALINFHEDVNMEEAHQTIYYLITGEKTNSPLILQIPYSLGIGIGMATFFNHMFKKKWKKEPSPLEVEMYMYNKNLDDFILQQNKQVKGVE